MAELKAVSAGTKMNEKKDLAKNQKMGAAKETPPVRSFWSVKLVVLSILVMVIGLLIGAELAGWINLRQQVSRLPGLSNWRGENQSNTGKVVTGMNLLEKENKELKKQLQEQQDLLQGAAYERQALEQNKVAQEQRIQELEKRMEAKKVEPPLMKVDYQQLAIYYAEMKPAVVVAIMDQLEDEIVLGILKEMEPEQVSKILAVMKPERAAKLSKMFTTTENSNQIIPQI
ncbi:MAG: hypothetical protein GX295_02270 [Syntrophomonadaceae bacterium]|nr:hypothetical protein [Syntrophomonadaceae bacterium]